MARDYQTRAYAPYSNFRVGAAVLAADDQLYGGCNIENASFGGTICAERVALSQAISRGVRQFKEIAIIGDADYTYPCGICRQFMAEFSPDMLVHIIGPDEIRHYRLSELLPHAFGPQELNNV